MTALIADVRAAIRALAAARGFTATAVLMLSASLALTVTILTVVNAYVLRGLPYPEASRLYQVNYLPAGRLSFDDLARLDWNSLDDIIEQSIAWDLDVFYILGQHYPEAMAGAWVTPGYIDGFGVRVARGRMFDAHDYERSNRPVALISHRLWQTHFGGDEGIVGRTFSAYVSDRPEEPEVFTIVGVLTEDFWHVNAYTEVLAPLKARTYPYMVRLRPGVSASTASTRIEALIRQGLTDLPPAFSVALTSTHAGYIAPVRPVLWAISAVAVLVLIIGAANVAVLMLVRGTGREREFAVRLALGASEGRLARLLAAEGLLLGAASTVLGVCAAAAVVSRFGDILQLVLERRVPGGPGALAIDGRVAAGAAIAGGIVTLIFTLAPAAALRRTDLASSLTEGGRSATPARAARSRAVLIAVEVAASFALIVGAALMARSAHRMLEVDFGFDSDDVVTASLALRERSFPDAASRVAFFDRLTNRLHGVAGTTSRALADWRPLQGSRLRPVQTADGAATTAANPFAVSDGFFQTLRLRIVDGRAFTTQDRVGSEPVAIVSRTLAGVLWPGRRAVGQLITIELEPAAPPLTLRIAGVVNDVRQSHADTEWRDLYLPLAQHPTRFPLIYLRGQFAPGWERDLRAAVADVDPEAAVGEPDVLTRVLERERTRPRFLAGLLSTFAAIAFGLALLGMHGVVAYAVRRRRREIAIRIAVGATPSCVAGQFLRAGAGVLVVGLVAGMAGALALGRLLESQLFGVAPAEPFLLAGAAALFGIAGLLAIAWPAWRAAALDPVQALRDE